MIASMSSAEIERAFPHTTTIVTRGSWFFSEHSELNAFVHGLGANHSGAFNCLTTYRFGHACQASALAEYALDRRLHRLIPNSRTGAERHEVAEEWVRLADEREAILAWARNTGFLQEVVQTYRFERHRGSYSCTAHREAGALIAKRYPEIADPLNYAGVIIVWAEREHRVWFWRCCRDHHVL